MSDPVPSRLSWLSDVPNRRWLATAIAVKLVLYLFLIWQGNRIPPTDPTARGQVVFSLFQHSGDESSYIDPIENLLEYGTYESDHSRIESRAGRMPGYGLTYLAFRWFTAPNVAKTLLVFLQVLLSGISLYCLAVIGWLVFKSRLVFYATFILYGSSVFVSVWDPVIITESLGTSALIFFLYHLLRYRETHSLRTIFWAGCFYAYMVWLRPFLAPLALLTLPVLFDRSNVRATMVRLAAFSIAFLVAEGAWIGRNYAVFTRIIPLQYNVTAAYPLSEADMAVRTWLQAVGEDLTWWARDNLAGWLRKESIFHDENYRVKPSVFASTYGLKELRAARDIYSRGIIEPNPITKRALNAEAARQFTAFRDSFRSEKPFQYYVVSPLRLLKVFVVTSGPVLPLPAFAQLRHAPLLLAFKVGTVFLYWFVLIVGLVGVSLLMYTRSSINWIVATPTLYILVFFPFVLRVVELRFLTCGFPSLCLGAAHCVAQLVSRFSASETQWRMTRPTEIPSSPQGGTR